MKKSLNLILIGIILLFFTSCSSTNQKKSSIQKPIAEKSFKELEKNIIKQETKNRTDKFRDGTFGEISKPTYDITKDDSEKYNTGKSGWIKIRKKKHFSYDATRSQAKKQLLQQMRTEAVSKKVGTLVEVSELLTDIMTSKNNQSYEQSSWSGFFRSTVSGVITNEKPGKINTYTPYNEEKGFDLELEYQFYVEPVTGDRDLAYWVEAKLENNMLNSGDRLVIKIKPSKNSYIYIFNLMADNNATLMYPNKYMEDNYVESNDLLILPNPKIEQYISFFVNGIEGQKITSESIYIICSKQKIKLPKGIPMIGESMVTFAKNSENFVSLQRWLTKIPLSQRIEKVLIYYITN
jgi:hypothetical protein